MSPVVTTEVCPLADLLLRAAHSHPDRAALILPSARASYAELRAGALSIARSLLAMGARRGAHIALLIPNSVEYAQALFGVMLAGCVAVPLNTRHRAAELGYIIDHADIFAILTSRHDEDPADLHAVLEEALRSAGSDGGRRRIALVRGEAPGIALGRRAFLRLGEAVTEAQVERVRRCVRVRDPALIIYTSGTTAHPKGCVLPHEAVTRGPVERARHRLSVGDHDVTWAAGPLFHIGSLAPFIGSVGVAGTFLTDSWFDAGRAIRLMAEHGATLAWPWFSAIVQAIVDHPGFAPERFATLRHLFLIAPPALVDRVQELLPETEILQACGMTETAGIFALSDRSEDRLSRSTTQGKAYPGVEVRIVDADSSADLPDGHMGEILVRGYNVMDGYWADRARTDQAIDADGWLRTGDLYTRLPGGSLVFAGRCKDMLKVGGENVAAVEVEAVLAEHPAVKIAEVVGRPDVRLDEVPVAFVELQAGRTISEDALIAHCRARAAGYKVPRAIVFMTDAEWPMSATKIDKRALRARLT
ncbi:class I adenylate-forming enzyme family protein [Sphingomonas sp. YL-JM2C]